MLRLPFAFFDSIRRPFVRQARQHPRSIVIIKPCCIGDILMTTPLLETLQQRYPDARMTYVVGSWSKTIAEHQPGLSNVIDCGTVGIPGRYRFSDYLKLARQLRSQHFDLAFVLDRSPMLTLLPWLAGIPRRVGPDSLGRGFSLTDRVPVSSSRSTLQHQAEIYLDLARALHIPIQQPRMHFVPTPEERASIQPVPRPQIAVFPGGGSNPGMQLTSKRWPLEKYRLLVARLIHEFDVQVLLIGGPEDRALTTSLLEGLDGPTDRVLNLAGTTNFGQTAALIEQCALFIGNDSSPMHLAAAVGTPVIAIFGPTSPAEYGPYPLDNPRHIAIWRHPTGEPCFFLGKMQACSNCTCMQSVTVQDVWEAVLRLLPQVPSKASLQ
ncbi:lipopolysaccharide heptosyltransferase II [Tengunoibacter tsumagoiensis]|uniref:lipopolysaccharide heptosyltransferase II n=1 Tax=Tengunoibacter tsumagoiensis TaxID=2014871 RepID=A0A402A2U8_9CHLR|nr:lipopolysaccharide heptosyltransferase II [Tengunoibacter tsumagoiensis]GCE13478.1 ADP-heptose--LPS heptosyltransferase [Tengunoibacter tsumagoiensis]